MLSEEAMELAGHKMEAGLEENKLMAPTTPRTSTGTFHSLEFFCSGSHNSVLSDTQFAYHPTAHTHAQTPDLGRYPVTVSTLSGRLTSTARLLVPILSLALPTAVRYSHGCR